MATIDINQYIEQSGMRKARFGGYEPDDVRQAMLDLCSDYEQRLNTAAQQVRGAQQEAEALRRRCQTLIGQNQNLATQNASLAGKADRIARMQSDMETRYSKVQERNHSLTDQVAMLRLKNTDLELKNKELTERAENADAALRIKGREHDQAKQQVLAERDSVVAGAQKEAARIRSQAREEADQLLKDTNLKAEAIDQLAREQAIGQARKMVQAATEETREIQNAHRLRLQDLQSRIDAMEQQRAKLMDFLAKMIAELQETQDYAQQNTPQPMENKETTEPSAEPQLDLSPTAVDAAASALRTEDTNDAQPAPAPAKLTDEDGQPRNCVVAPGWNDHANDTRVARPVPDGPEKQPQPEYFDTTPTANELHTLQTPAGRSRRQAEGRGRNSGRHFLLPHPAPEGGADFGRGTAGARAPHPTAAEPGHRRGRGGRRPPHRARSPGAARPSACCPGGWHSGQGDGQRPAPQKGCSRPACPAPQAGGRIKPETNRTIPAPRVWNCAVLPK